MKNGFIQNINSLLAVILAAEKKEQGKYYDAVNSIAGDSTRIMAEANARIKKLRDVVSKLKDFQFEVMEILEGEEVLYETHEEAATVEDDGILPEADYYVPPKVDSGVLPKAFSNEELIAEVCETLIVEKPFKFLGMDCKYVGIDPASLDEPYVKLTNSMYVSTAEPADVVCREILSKCGIDEQDYHLYYKGA